MPSSFYDISIWEEIRSIVSWKTDRLVESISKEIPKDTSLAEFQGKHTVPLQLREVMEQRANAWVQRLYDLCCDAYKSRGEHCRQISTVQYGFTAYNPSSWGRRIHRYTIKQWAAS